MHGIIPSESKSSAYTSSVAFVIYVFQHSVALIFVKDEGELITFSLKCGELCVRK